MRAVYGRRVGDVGDLRIVSVGPAGGGVLAVSGDLEGR